MIRAKCFFRLLQLYHSSISFLQFWWTFFWVLIGLKSSPRPTPVISCQASIHDSYPTSARRWPCRLFQSPFPTKGSCVYRCAQEWTCIPTLLWKWTFMECSGPMRFHLCILLLLLFLMNKKKKKWVEDSTLSCPLITERRSYLSGMIYTASQLSGLRIQLINHTLTLVAVACPSLPLVPVPLIGISHPRLNNPHYLAPPWA